MTPGITAVPKQPPHLPAGVAGGGPLVSFARSNLSVRWASAFHSLLELAEACDVPVRWSCRTGVCHNCETGLISGSVIYGPDPVDPPAGSNLLICCSRPEGDVALDL
jgi:ferredoxin